MGISLYRKLPSKTIPDDFSPLCGNFKLSRFCTWKMYHNATKICFLDSSRNLDLDRVFSIIYIYDFVDIQWGSLEVVTVVDIDGFGIFANL